MRDDLPSVTAILVAFARGVAAERPLSDRPLTGEPARELLPAPIARLLPRGSGAAQAFWRVATGGLVDQMALRSAAIDEALRAALREGVTQVVVLGAGLDARAYRLDELSAARVFEVDHPASQRFKLAHLAGLRPRARDLVHVGVDFARDALGPSLERAGHDPHAPTFWIWEGVTMYLPTAATRATLSVVGERSATDSVLAVTYLATHPHVIPTSLRKVASAALSLVGEPFRASYTPPELAALLAEVGLQVTSDENSLDWARRFHGHALAAAPFRGERLILARKR